jgi:hypothetical protein
MTPLIVTPPSAPLTTAPSICPWEPVAGGALYAAGAGDGVDGDGVGGEYGTAAGGDAGGEYGTAAGGDAGGEYEAGAGRADAGGVCVEGGFEGAEYVLGAGALRGVFELVPFAAAPVR